VIAVPAEGVVSKELVSLTEGGQPFLALPGQSVKKLWVRFVFAALPRASSVTLYWVMPSGAVVGEVEKPITATEVSDLGSAQALPAGVYQVVIKAHGKVAGRVKVRIGRT
jgi:hypothetical protein